MGYDMKKNKNPVLSPDVTIVGVVRGSHFFI